jgi:hypothetical protein
MEMKTPDVPCIKLENLKDFEEELLNLRTQLQTMSKRGVSSNLLFRGHRRSSWQLQTTLERSDLKHVRDLTKYLQVASRIKPEIETLTSQDFKAPEFEEWEQDFGKRLDLSMGTLTGYGYLIYLRHHGFPSPLLDWTRSPYIALFFAFRSAKRKRDEMVAVYAYCEMPAGHKRKWSAGPQVVNLGPYVRSHRRHFSQQSEYTVCVSHPEHWTFENHQQVCLSGPKDQDYLAKFELPSCERDKILKRLDEFNLNAYSLFGSEDALMETIESRELAVYEDNLRPSAFRRDKFEE